MLIDYKLGQTSVVLRVKLRNSSVSTGAGLTGLTSASTGLIISTIANNEATATAYTVAGSNVETITTLGTFAAPTSGKCRFKEVDATNHPGVYEIQIADARFAVSSAKGLLVSVSGATNLAEADALIPLRTVNPYATDFGLTLAKTTNITGLNDIAATAIVSSGAITTSGGAVSNVTLCGTLTTYTGNTPQTGDAFARLGAPAGASIAADIATRSTYAGGDTSGTTTLLSRVPSAITISGGVVEANVVEANGTPITTASAPANFSALAITAGGAVTVGTNSDKTGYSLDLTQTLSAARAVTAIADTSLTMNDALHCSIASAAGQETLSGTTYTVKTPSTGTTIRVFTLNSATTPTTRT